MNLEIIYELFYSNQHINHNSIHHQFIKVSLYLVNINTREMTKCHFRLTSDNSSAYILLLMKFEVNEKKVI